MKNKFLIFVSFVLLSALALERVGASWVHVHVCHAHCFVVDERSEKSCSCGSAHQENDGHPHHCSCEDTPVQDDSILRLFQNLQFFYSNETSIAKEITLLYSIAPQYDLFELRSNFPLSSKAVFFCGREILTQKSVLII